MKSRPVLPPIDQAQRYSIPEAIVYLRTSRKSLYRDVNAGKLRLTKQGKRSYVHGSELVRFACVSD